MTEQDHRKAVAARLRADAEFIGVRYKEAAETMREAAELLDPSPQVGRIVTFENDLEGLFREIKQSRRDT